MKVTVCTSYPNLNLNIRTQYSQIFTACKYSVKSVAHKWTGLYRGMRKENPSISLHLSGWKLIPRFFLNVKEESPEARISRMLRHRHPSKDCSNVENRWNCNQGLSLSFEKYPIYRKGCICVSFTLFALSNYTQSYARNAESTPFY